MTRKEEGALEENWPEGPPNNAEYLRWGLDGEVVMVFGEGGEGRKGKVPADAKNVVVVEDPPDERGKFPMSPSLKLAPGYAAWRPAILEMRYLPKCGSLLCLPGTWPSAASPGFGLAGFLRHVIRCGLHDYFIRTSEVPRVRTRVGPVLE